ncbi:SAM-dependent methyltransferase [Actinoplanes lutulentus]|uniref:2-polyprenyl-3-methyl-5-hydroxy-6-metoxy-1, 4-benzoquinol methylase n=1 Tax=Actinoplanes lutulentus TaxID=1287878 RepID=A0A327Z3B4_9ACTN|nr:class I SAM-dependent methyltransferase [Actinoplanes lutulentus]MBB2947870.1 SAM-dependent methyltransferase [Actinoplanes lutulentus]RAK29817.1 2-polyprenyl-3-methyl-5-hydroxy-6-metoxy-1,4-benzoquinol methylase [Actinoplanes lutulentus]
MATIDAISGYYDRGGEVARLHAGRGRLEFLRTQDVLRRRLPAAPARILDVGGGAGAHARWLAADGYPVRLVDPMPLHVEHAGAIDGVDAVLGDARRLDEPDAAYQATLLLGPLYHLPDRDERVTALREAARVTAPGGVVAAATISRYAGLYDTLIRGRYPEPEVRRITDAELVTGVHEPFDQDLFTLAYFHHPDEIAGEFADAGLTGATTYALEGGAWLFADRDGWLEGDERTQALLEALRSVEEEPAMFGISSHLLTVAVLGGE